MTEEELIKSMEMPKPILCQRVSNVSLMKSSQLVGVDVFDLAWKFRNENASSNISYTLQRLILDELGFDYPLY